MSSSRRGVGLSAFTSEALNAAYTTHGTSIRTAHVESLQTQLSVFQQLLHQFSITHAKDIRSNPTFRAEFARMCTAIGVDPLASSHTSTKDGGGKGSFWAQMLGGSVNDFYFELAVRVVEVCRGSRAENGGLIGVEEVKRLVQEGRGVGGGMEVSEYVLNSILVCVIPLLTRWQ
jgi:ESCRT-II complex subunit VPS22